MRMSRRMCLHHQPSKQVTITNMLTNGYFDGTDGWYSTDSTLEYGSTTAFVKMIATAQYGRVVQPFSMISGHQYYMHGKIYADSDQIAMRLNTGASVDCFSSGLGAYEFFSAISEATSTGTGYAVCLRDFRASGWDYAYARYFSLVDLTESFGAGNEPTATQMDSLLAQYNNEWLDGAQTVTYDW